MTGETLDDFLAQEPADLESKLRDNIHIKESIICDLLRRLSQLLDSEPNVLYLPSPVTVCGDIHGQMLDLFSLFKTTQQERSAQNQPPDAPYLFLGDYVDRGYSSVETFAYLAYLKLKYPNRYYLLRGNHESREVNQMYGLYNDCQATYGNAGLWHFLNHVFDLLPIAAVIDHRIFCVHGGLSPTITYIEQISSIERKRDIALLDQEVDDLQLSKLEAQGIADLTWSDPETVSRFMPNRRGKGWLFGQRQTEAFLRTNKLGSNGFIARSHQIAENGHLWLHSDNLVIVWSAPNYCYKSGNGACVMHVPGDQLKGVSFWAFEKDPISHVKPVDIEFQLGYFA
jgi:diadenosine tetraphosphatase ApaH/serine/threonine PP2A family protein phosphatase